MEITTGISAPPIGIINKNPIKNETANIIQKKLGNCVEHNKYVKTTIEISRSDTNIIAKDKVVGSNEKSKDSNFD